MASRWVNNGADGFGKMSTGAPDGAGEPDGCENPSSSSRHSLHTSGFITMPAAADWRIIHRMMHIVGPVAQVLRLDLQQSLGLGFAHQAEVHHLKVFGEHAHEYRSSCHPA